VYTRPTQPLTTGGVLDDGCRLYKASVRPLFFLSLFSMVLTLLPVLYLDSKGITEPARVLELFDWPTGIALIAILLVLQMLTAAMIARTDAIACGVPMSLRGAIGVGMRRMPAMLVTMILIVLAGIIGLVLLIVPGLIVSVSLFFACFIVVIERKPPLKSLLESHRLVRGCWWQTATIISVGATIAIVAELLAEVPLGVTFEVLQGQGQYAAWTFVAFFLGCLVPAAVIPLGTCICYCTYQDLKLRRQAAAEVS
jgi:hypothetical protein